MADRKPKPINSLTDRWFMAQYQKRQRAKRADETRYFMTRYLMTFTGVQYGELPTAKTFSGDFKIKFTGYVIQKESLSTIVGKSQSSSDRFLWGLNTDGTLRANAPGYSSYLFQTTNSVVYDEINTVELERVGAVMTQTVNGQSETAACPTNPMTIDNLFQHLGGSNFIGIPLLLKVWDNGTHVPGLGDIRIDDPTSIYQRDYSADQSDGFVGIELKNTVIPGDFEQYERRAGWGYWVNEFWPQLLSYSVDFTRWGPLGCSSSYDGSVSTLTVTNASNPYLEINTADTAKYNTAAYTFLVDVTAPAGRTISVGLLRDGYSDFDFEYVVATGNRQTIKIDRIFSQVPGSVRCRFSLANSEQGGQVGDVYTVHGSCLILSSESETSIETSGIGGNKISYADGADS